MPYCSIEEAWGIPFEGKKNNENLLETSNILDNEYLSLDTKSYFSNTDNNKYKRTMKRLPNHNGSLNRYCNIKNSNNKSISYENNKLNKYPKKNFNIEAPPSCLNVDTPIEKYNYNLQNNLNTSKNYFKTSDYDLNQLVDQENIDINDSYENCKSYLSDNNIDNNIDVTSDHNLDKSDIDTVISFKHNKKRKKKNIEHFIDKNSFIKKNDNLYEIIIYIITGIFIIFILDIFTKLGKNNN